MREPGTRRGLSKNPRGDITLAEAGIDKNPAKQARKFAVLPAEEEFEDLVGRRAEAGHPLIRGCRLSGPAQCPAAQLFVCFSQKERAMDMFFAYPFSIGIIAALLAAVIVIFGGTRWAFAGPALADGRPRAAPVAGWKPDDIAGSDFLNWTAPRAGSQP